MKKLLFVIVVLSFGLLSCTQNPPVEVTNAFAEKFSNASDVSWGNEDEHEWEAEFKMDGQEMSACYNNEGQWLETEVEVAEDDLPQTVKTTIETEFAGWEFDEIERIETKDFKGFEVEMKKGDEETEALIGFDGKLIMEDGHEEHSHEGHNHDAEHEHNHDGHDHGDETEHDHQNDNDEGHDHDHDHDADDGHDHD